MEIKLVIGMEKELYERIDRLTEALTTFSGIRMTTVNSVEKAEIKNEPTKKIKAETKTAESDTDVPWKEETSDIEYTVDDVISAMQNLGIKKGKQEAKRLLGKYNASKVSELDKAVYGDIIKDIEGMI